MMSYSVDKSSLRSQRIKMLTILGIFALPVIVAYIWFANSDNWRPASTTNYGEFIVPARPLAAFTMPGLDGVAINESFLRKHWTLVYLGGAECDAVCQTNLYNMRQIRLALNEKMDRVERLWVLTGATQTQPSATLLSEHQGLHVAQPDSATLEQLLHQFKSNQSTETVTGRIYLVDPLGNLMMQYPPDADPKGILKDILRLLKTSWVR